MSEQQFLLNVYESMYGTYHKEAYFLKNIVGAAVGAGETAAQSWATPSFYKQT